MILYINDSNEIIYKSDFYLYTSNNKQHENVIRKTIPCTIASKIKNLEINLLKEVQDSFVY